MKFKNIFIIFALLGLIISACAQIDGQEPSISIPSGTDITNTITPEVSGSAEANSQVFEGNGLTVYLETEFPQTPSQMNVYSALPENPATPESVQLLAEQFQMNGEIYELGQQSGIPSGILGSEKEYLVVDGNRQLRVRSDKYYTYYPDYLSHTENLLTPAPANADEIIAKFLKDNEFDADFKIEQIDLFNYAALALSPDNLSVHYGNLQFSGFRFRFDKNGITEVDASFLNYDQPVQMPVISADEALQKLLDPSDPFGYLQSGSGSGFFMVGDTILKQEDLRKWTRIRPLDEILTYNGYISSTGKTLNGGTPFVVLDGFPVTGKVESIPENTSNLYVEAQGQFHEVDGVKTFELETWKKSDLYEEMIMGLLKHEGDQFILENANGHQYILQDVPDEISLPMEHAFARGITRGDIFDWNIIDNTGGGGGGGGGGGPSGFYKINFSGTPVVFPTATPLMPTPETVYEPFEGVRGTITASAIPNADGPQHYSFLFLPYDPKYGGAYYFLDENTDNALADLHNRPVDIWGKLDLNSGLVHVDRYEDPYPEMKFQVISGSQRLETIEGQAFTVITVEDGKKYIAISTVGAPAPVQLTDPAFIPVSNDPASIPSPNADNVLFEALIVPDETFLGYPAMRVFHTAPGLINGKVNTLEVTSNLPDIYPGPPPVDLTLMTIEKIELAYFAPDRMYGGPQGLEDSPLYVQPVWRFSGHYNDGSTFEILIQALQEKYLLPEVDESTGP